MSTLFGLGLAVISSIFKSGKSISTKIAANSTDDYTTSFFTRFISSIMFFILLLYSGKVHIVGDYIFILYLLINCLLFSIVTVLFTKSLRISDISLVSPIMSLIPVAVVIPSYILLEEVPNIYTGMGIILVTIGSYVLEISSKNGSYLDPLKSLYSNRGVQFAFIGVILASFIPSIDKIGIQMSNPIMWVFLTQLGSSILILVFYIHTAKEYNNIKEQAYNNYKILIIVGLFNGLIWILQSYAYTYTQVSYVQSVKRVSIILSIIGGYYIFGEKNIKDRLLGSIIILIGIIIIFVFI